MKKIIIFFVFLIALETVFSMPGIPSDFYGTVKIGGQDAPIGTVITAYIDGQNYGSFTVTVSGKYGLFSITGDDLDTSGKEGGVNGDTLIFKINGQTVMQIGTWQQGESIELNLALTTSTSGSSSSSTITQLIKDNGSDGNASTEENQEEEVKREDQTPFTKTSEIETNDESSEPENLNILKNEKKTNDYEISMATVGWIIIIAILIILIFVLFKKFKKEE